jgi:hypothetical protein
VQLALVGLASCGQRGWLAALLLLLLLLGQGQLFQLLVRLQCHQQLLRPVRLLHKQQGQAPGEHM